MSIQVNLGIELRLNSVERATVKEVRYDPCEWSRIGQEQIYMETTDGRVCNWFINRHCRVRIAEFIKTSEDIQEGRIVPGTEITITYNAKGILAFSL